MCATCCIVVCIVVVFCIVLVFLLSWAYSRRCNHVVLLYCFFRVCCSCSCCRYCCRWVPSSSSFFVVVRRSSSSACHRHPCCYHGVLLFRVVSCCFALCRVVSHCFVLLLLVVFLSIWLLCSDHIYVTFNLSSTTPNILAKQILRRKSAPKMLMKTGIMMIGDMVVARRTCTDTFLELEFWSDNGTLFTHYQGDSSTTLLPPSSEHQSQVVNFQVTSTPFSLVSGL